MIVENFEIRTSRIIALWYYRKTKSSIKSSKEILDDLISEYYCLDDKELEYVLDEIKLLEEKGKNYV